MPMRKPDDGRIDNIIADVFRLTGTRITADDPIVAVLLMQEQSFKSAFSEFADHQAKMRTAFLEQMAVHESNITQAAAKLEQYREQLLLDLAGQTNRQIGEVESKVYGSVSGRVAKDVETANRQLLARLQKMQIITLICVVALMLVFFVVMR